MRGVVGGGVEHKERFVVGHNSYYPFLLYKMITNYIRGTIIAEHKEYFRLLQKEPSLGRCRRRAVGERQAGEEEDEEDDNMT